MGLKGTKLTNSGVSQLSAYSCSITAATPNIIHEDWSITSSKVSTAKMCGFCNNIYTVLTNFTILYHGVERQKANH